MSTQHHSMSTINSGLLENEDTPVEVDESDALNYSLVSDSEIYPSTKHKQAALLLHKGHDNEKITSSMATRTSELAYGIVHHPAYVWFNLFTALALLLLAVGEHPAMVWIYKEEREPVEIELVLLFLLGFNLVLKLVWLEWKLFLRSRGMLVAIVIFVMAFECVVILARGRGHLRLSRALRPFLLLDTFLMSGVRRVVRQIFLCLKHIFDVMFVLFFFVAVFSVMAYYFFDETDVMYFSDLTKSFVSMFITLTTANHPDVFLEAYNNSRIAPVFFMIYMFVTFYYFSNVLLAVVFAKFKQAEEGKYKKLYLHRREALKRAFKILKDENGVSFIDFLCCLQQYRPQMAPHEAMCVFKSLKQTPEDMSDQYLSWDEFSNLFDNVGMKWTLTHAGGYDISWYDELNILSSMAKATMKTAHDSIRHWLFDSIMTFIIVINLILLVVYIIKAGNKCEERPTALRVYGLVGSFIFTIIYIIEISLRLFLDGPLKYFNKGWNIIDFLIVMTAFLCLIAEAALFQHHHDCTDDYKKIYKYLELARALVLLRLLKLKRNYLYLLRIMSVLAERMISVVFLLVIVYYSYAIIGMEAFSGEKHRVFPNCCKNAWYEVGEYYANDSSDPDDFHYYWLNNFDDLWKSYVTLYELMVVNNWFIIMEGFVSTTSSVARVYFILFWITTTLVVNTAIVYIVDAFEAGLLALNTTQHGEELKQVVRLRLNDDDINELDRATAVTTQYSKRWQSVLSILNVIKRFRTIRINIIKKREGQFRGSRLMDNHDLRQHIYSRQIELWREEFEQKQSASVNSHTAPSNITFKEIEKLILEKIKQLVYYLFG